MTFHLGVRPTLRRFAVATAITVLATFPSPSRAQCPGTPGTDYFTCEDEELLCDAYWIDMHAHCSTNTPRPVDTPGNWPEDGQEAAEYCQMDAWDATVDEYGSEGKQVAGVVLGKSYWALNRIDIPAYYLAAAYPQTVYELQRIIATAYSEGADGRPPEVPDANLELFYFASLECLVDSDILDEDAFVEDCEEDVDAWIEKGAKGFKDHIGKTDTEEDDRINFLGLINRWNGTCPNQPPGGGGSPTPNEDCMREEMVFYPTDLLAYRRVLKYIVHEKKLPIVTHIVSHWGQNTLCWDEGELVSCWDATYDRLQDFTQALKASKDAGELTVEDVRRVIIAHTGFLNAEGVSQHYDRHDAMRELLLTGVSIDLARAPFSYVNTVRDACWWRGLLNEFSTQILWGMDSNTARGCDVPEYPVWDHVFEGTLDHGQTEDFSGAGLCGDRGDGAFHALDLNTQHADVCLDEWPDDYGYNVDPDVLDKVRKNNFLELYRTSVKGIDCPV